MPSGMPANVCRNLNVNVNQLLLDNKALLLAEVNDGAQGNIRLNIRDLLILRNGSVIT